MKDLTRPGRTRTGRALPGRFRTGLTLASASAVALTLLSPLAADQAGAAVSENLVRTSSFADGTGGWYTTGVGELSSSWGRNGGDAARITAGRAGATSLTNSPAIVDDTTAGATYASSVWVRRATTAYGTAQGPVTVTLRLKEFAGGTLYRQGAETYTLRDSDWHRIDLSLVAAGDDHFVGLSVTTDSVPRGRSYVVDDISLQVTQPTTSTPSPTSPSPTTSTPSPTTSTPSPTTSTPSPSTTTPSPSSTTPSPSTTTPASVAPDGWRSVYRNDFTTLRDVGRAQSNTDVNSGLRPTDTSNDLLQKPTLRSNTEVVSDNRATDGAALGVFTRVAQYQTNSGTQTGWTNGRFALTGANQSPPFIISTRVRMTPSANVKAAVMWWPAGGGWPWEVDFIETFGGDTTRDYWGSRQNVTQRWHGDLNGDGRAVEQLIHDDRVDATQYHVYTLTVLPNRMSIQIDGVETYSTTDRRYIPDSPGFFSVGKGLTHQRNIATRTEDGVFIDYVELFKPA